jgi:Cu/Ag efflux protein CusF
VQELVENRMKRIAAMLALALAAGAALAQLADGEVRRVDREGKKITLKHGPIQNVDMPAMTMAFAVKDPAMLDRVKAGDQVRFRVEKIGETYTLVAIERAR